jgi:site-specific recombinase XerD
LTFALFAREWLETYPAASGLKRSTARGYHGILERHLIPAFGGLKLDAISVSHVERYVALKRRSGCGARTVNLHLNLLHKLLRTALRRQLVRTNVVSAVERPRAPRRRWTILSPEEVRAVEAAFGTMIAEAADEERAWREQARVLFLVSVGLGLRRGEILGLLSPAMASTSSRRRPKGRPSTPCATRAPSARLLPPPGSSDRCGRFTTCATRA